MDPGQFKQHYFSLYPKLYRIARALVNDTKDAEDILQEAYCKLWDKREALESVLQPEAFAVRLVKNLCLDFLRSPRAVRPGETVGEAPPATAPDPEQAMVKKDELTQLRLLIGRLPEKQRQVICLRGIRDCSPEEIEEITGLSAVNIRTLLSRARKTLREEFEKLNGYGR